MRFIDQFQVILLDMARTFMFGVDRFAEEEDFAATYRGLGGTSLSDDTVQCCLRGTVARMQADYDRWDMLRPFPSVRQYLQTCPQAQNFPLGAVALLEQTVALHEVGTIPASHAATLWRLRQTHRLGVLSDIFAPGTVFLREFRRAGVLDLFEMVLFSSEHGYIKPSPFPFRQACEGFQVAASQIVYAGDSFERDIVGAHRAGLATVWITSDQQPGKAGIRPDGVIAALPELDRVSVCTSLCDV